MKRRRGYRPNWWVRLIGLGPPWLIRSHWGWHDDIAAAWDRHVTTHYLDPMHGRGHRPAVESESKPKLDGSRPRPWPDMFLELHPFHRVPPPAALPKKEDES